MWLDYLRALGTLDLLRSETDQLCKQSKEHNLTEPTQITNSGAALVTVEYVDIPLKYCHQEIALSIGWDKFG